MSRSRALLLIFVIAFGLLWQPVLRPAGQAAILLLDVFSDTLVGADIAGWITPLPRVTETTETFSGTQMRVSWWRPGWGDRHPAVMLVNGATPVGNDNEATRDLGESLARAGYLVMLPEFPFLKAGRLEAGATAQVDGAFAALRARPETKDQPVGAFGFSVGAGVLLAAAGREVALKEADYLAVLGAYYDLDTYLASVASGAQLRNGELEPWPASAEARERLPPAAIEAVPPAHQQEVRKAMRSTDYEEALGRLRALPAEARTVFDALSPKTTWTEIRQPTIFWLHDPNDTFEPVAEAEAAAAAPRDGEVVLVVPRLVSHAAPSEEARAQGPLFVIGELWQLLLFSMRILQLAG